MKFFFHLVTMNGEPFVTSCHLKRRVICEFLLSIFQNIRLGRICTHYRFEKQVSKEESVVLFEVEVFCNEFEFFRFQTQLQRLS